MTSNLLFITTNYSGCKCGENNCDCINDTGVYLEEFAVPYLVFEKSDINVVVASPEGKLSPVDESSMSCSNPEEWDKCIKVLRNTEKLSEVNLEEFDGVYFPGGHGPMFDIAEDSDVRIAVEYFYNNNKLISAICHGVAGLVNATDKCGNPIVMRKRITSFTNKEESISKYQDLVPFLLETRLRELGADYVAEEPFSEHVEVDGNIITGQNQKSSLLIAEKIVEFLS